MDDATLAALHTDPSVVSAVVKSPAAADQPSPPTQTQTSAEQQQMALALAHGAHACGSRFTCDPFFDAYSLEHSSSTLLVHCYTYEYSTSTCPPVVNALQRSILI